MSDEITSTDRRKLYKVRLTPGGEEYLVEASGAVNAQQKGIGLAALDGVDWHGLDVSPASENDITDYYGEEE